jgi:hypothetical protein
MSLYYSEYESTNNKTLKNRKNNREKINSLRSSLKKPQEPISAIDDESLANFDPLPPPRLSRTPQTDKPVTRDIDLNTNQGAQDYYKQYAGMYQASQLPTQPESGGDNLMAKLNYVIHLLEEQQDQKTGSVTEEIILYAFLGVFIIFIIDSFARAGKYVR